MRASDECGGFFYFTSMNITGIILAGGKSSRMKTEKGLVLYKEKPLIQYTIDVLNQVCDQVLISSNTISYDHFGYKIIKDEIRDIGPVGGIHASLNASATDDNIILSCDTPFISVDYLHYLLQNKEDAMVAVPWFGNDKYEPISAYYHKGFASRLAGFIEEANYKLPEIYQQIPLKKLIMDNTLDFYHDKLFYNINSQEDISKLNI